MDLCNTHYYGTRDPFGSRGDFTTAPEISQIFGELIGAWLADCWLRLGSPKAVLCEMGPGRGTLMKDILRATKHVPHFHASLRVRMIETSPVLQAIQKKTLSGAHSDIEWKSAFEDMPSLPLLLVANEFFDALPIHQFLNGDVERTIGMKDGNLHWIQEGEVKLENSPASLAIMKQLAAHISIHKGTALIIDYGYENQPGYETSEGADTLQALKDHAYADPLKVPGEADLTAHVDFGALKEAAQGLSTHLTTQGDFLRRLGAELRATALCRNAPQEQQKTILSGLERLMSSEQMGTIFKVLAVTSSLENPPGF